PMEAWYGSDDERKYYLPAMKKTLINVLIDSDMSDPQKRCDGILAEIKDSKILTNTLKLFMNDANDSVDFCRAVEQISGAVKLTKSEFTKFNEGDKGEYSYGNYKQLKFPDWMFVKGRAATWDHRYGRYTEFQTMQGNTLREGDFVLDDALDSIIGHNAAGPGYAGYGLAEYTDDKNLYIEEDWEDFNKSLDILAVLLNEDSSYSISQDFMDLLDAMLAKKRLYTPDEINGLLYGIGKLFTYYDNIQKQWIYQGYEMATHDAGFNNTYNIFKHRLPMIHDIIKDDTGNNYYSIIKTQAALNAENGLMEYMIDTLIETDCMPYRWEDALVDIHYFLEDDIVKEPGSPLWSTLTDLLNDMGKAISDSEKRTDLDTVYENYGFQLN
ncbi:MAG: hypothetical protein GY863_23555, partial [bacterium]|nr:hypothetical protein [bacterium]